MGNKTFLILFAWLACTIGIASADDALTEKEQLGRKIYREGSDGSQDKITLTLGLTESPIPGTAFACTNCHGLEGEGKEEGSLKIPAITTQYLSGKNQPNTPNQKNYDERALIRAITQGIGLQNKPLSTAMPRYRFSNSQAQALLAYLKLLGSAQDIEPGINALEVQLGTLLPLTGKQSQLGNSLKATLDACIADLNNQSLIYGRKISLTALDSGSTKAETLASTKQLISDTKPFALISGFFPDIDATLYKLLDEEKIPVIAPLTFMPYKSPNLSRSFFYFLPSYADQSRALIDYWLTNSIKNNTTTKPKLAVVYKDRAPDLAMVAAIRSQLQIHNLKTATEIILIDSSLTPISTQIEKLKTTEPDAIFFIGDTKELIAFNWAHASISRRPLVMGLLAMLGAEVVDNPNLTLTNLLLSTPFDTNDAGTKPFIDGLARRSVNLTSPGLQRIACEAVNFVAEGLKRTGRRLGRDKFIKVLDEIKNFPVGIMPPLEFDPNNRQAIRGAYPLLINTRANESTPLNAWVTPVDR